MQNLLQIYFSLFKPRRVCEVGAAHPFSAQVREFIHAGIPTILFEANPRLYFCLKEGWNMGDFKETWPNLPPRPFEHEGFGHMPHVQIHNVAIYDHKGEIDFFEANASSFVGAVNSPAVINDKFDTKNNDKFKMTVPCDTIDKYDTGDIDVLAVDAEGCEWFALKYLKSRPILICLETHGNNYVNPYMKEISDWMKANNYKAIHQNESDTLYLKS